MNRKNLNPRRQQGAALVIGLVLLLILTVLGVSGLGTATTEVRLADNNKQREYTFQAAESAVRESVQRGGLIVLTSGSLENDEVRTARDYAYDHNNASGDMADAGIDVNVRTVYRGRGNASEGEIGTFQNVHFLSHAEAQGARGARTTVRQGFFILAPAD
ncbi:MAG: PilX N-terminal domain-containing pilus assembly protein [Gammaproteobacteria bacterium]